MSRLGPRLWKTPLGTVEKRIAMGIVALDWEIVGRRWIQGRGGGRREEVRIGSILSVSGVNIVGMMGVMCAGEGGMDSWMSETTRLVDF